MAVKNVHLGQDAHTSDCSPFQGMHSKSYTRTLSTEVIDSEFGCLSFRFATHESLGARQAKP